MLGQPLLGRILGGRYRVAQNLSAGGFGHTYIVEDLQRPGQPRCVLKHLSFSSHNLDLLQQARRMFQQEAETLEQLGQHDRIPRLLAYFEEAGEFYLVQELIEGRSLSEELQGDHKLPVTEVVAILEDVLEILQFVHGQGVIHRDLKPENLIRRRSDGKLVLIDFGAVKTMDVLSTTPNHASVPVYTTGYAASEQCLGQPKFASDLYALGMIAIQALTGIHPTRLNTDPQSGNPLWQAMIEPRLEQFLQKLTAFHFNQRHPSAIEAQQALRASYTNVGTTLIPLEDSAQASPSSTRIQTVPPKKLLPIAILGIGSILATLWATQRLPWPIVNQSANVIDAPSLQKSLQISSGEKIFNPIANNPQKQSAANHMQARQFKQAIVDLKAARVQDRSDPEVLIHLHNAEIGDRPAYKIAVVVPLKDKPNFANEVLRGIAQAQDQVNSAGGIAGKPIKITLADDGNQPESAQQIARSFVQDPEILGVIGHGISQTTYAAAEIYKAGELPVVSPLSSAEKLSEFKQHLFRTIPSDRRSAKQLADYAVKHLKKTRIAVFYNAEDAYSTSLKEAFKDALDYGYDKKLLETIDINQSEFDAGERLNGLKQKKVEVIFLATNFDRFKDAMTIVQANDQQLPILAGETFYSKQTLNVGKKDVVGMVIAVPAQQVTLNSSNFQTVARQLWGIPVTWRSALGYDATQAILAGLRQSPTRQGIRATLANPKFQTTGAIQKVQFEDTGDRSSAIQLIQVVMPPKQPTPSFKPIQP